MVTLIGMLLLLFFSSCLYSSEFKYISSNKKPDVEDIKKKRQSFINICFIKNLEKKIQIILYKRWSLASCLNYIRKHFPVFFID